MANRMSCSYFHKIMKKFMFILIISLLCLPAHAKKPADKPNINTIIKPKITQRKEPVWFISPCTIMNYNGELAIFLNEKVQEKDSVRTELYCYLPLYEFTTNDVGVFVENVSDSIAKFDDYTSRSLSIYKHDDELFPEMALLTSRIINRRQIDRAKGVVINKYKIRDKTVNRGLFLYDDSPEWLKAFGLKRLLPKIPVIINKTMDIVSEWADTKSFTAIFSVSASGRIDIPVLHIGREPVQDWIASWKKVLSRKELQDERDMKNLNEWIREFYRAHGYPEDLPYWRDK